jgi:hypothetical protein
MVMRGKFSPVTPEQVMQMLDEAGLTPTRAALMLKKGKDHFRDFFSGKKAHISRQVHAQLVLICQQARENRGGLIASFDPDLHDIVIDADVKAASTEGRVNLTPGAVPEFDLRAGASYGGGYSLPAQVSDGERTYAADVVKAEWIFPIEWLRSEMRLSPNHTDLIAIDGPSMSPDLEPGDRVLIDRTSRDPKLEAMYAIRDGESIIVKHVQLVRDGSVPPRIVCRSSNAKYEPFVLVLDGESVEIIGRVAGRFTRT